MAALCHWTLITACEVGTIVIAILQMRTLRLKR